MDIKEYNEKLKELHEEALKKFGEYLKAEARLVFEEKNSQSGFVDKSLVDDFTKKRNDFQIASNAHTDFLRYGVQKFNKPREN